MEQLAENLARKISLKNGEDDVISVTTTPATPNSADLSLSLIGRVIIDRNLSLNSLRANISRLLNPVKGVDIQMIGSNLVTLKFAHPLDRKQALAGCPWMIERHPLLLEPRNPAITPDKQILVDMPIVIRVSQLSEADQTEEVARLIGNNLGKFIEVPKPIPGLYSPFFRIKIAVDVTRPLKRGIFFKGVAGTKDWIQVWYERLPTFCFLCGIVGHGEAKCPTRYEEGFEETEGDLPYGNCMRASTEIQTGSARVGVPFRVLPIERGSPQRNTEAGRGSQILSFGAKRDQYIGDGDQQKGENHNPNIMVAQPTNSNPLLLNGSPAKSVGSTSSSISQGRKKIVISNKRKGKEIGSEVQIASKRTQLWLRDEDDADSAAVAAGHTTRKLTFNSL